MDQIVADLFCLGAAQIVRLFPTFVWKCDLLPEIYKPINAAVSSHLKDQRRTMQPLDRGCAWQSDHGLHKLPELHDLVSCIEAATDAVLAFLHMGSRDISITGCWANVNAPGAIHAVHAHPNNFLSGVYYVEVHEGGNTINFHDPRAQAAVIRPPVKELTAYNTDQVVVSVSTGTVIVFPAWLPHSVDANQSASMRISISFNVMFASFDETIAKPLWGTQ
jgi:uncharacterized protein (TIGR02466 family)